MTRSSLIFGLGSEFDEFLLAPIREDNNGMLLSVLSALARLGIDPWEEAANLTEMSGEAATQRLSALIASLPAATTSEPERGSIAGRLIALLPHRPGAKGSPRKSLSRAAAVPKSPIAAYVVYYLIFLIFMLVGQWLMGSREPPALVGAVSTSSSAPVSPAAAPRKSSQ